MRAELRRAVLEAPRNSVRIALAEPHHDARTCLSIILAAGEGTRMKSATPKVLHEIAGLPMVAHVAAAARGAGGGDVALVVGHGADEVRKAAARLCAAAPRSSCRQQRLGTGACGAGGARRRSRAAMTTCW